MKILIIEDDNDINQLLADILMKEYQLDQAYSGTEGLRLFAQNHYDLVLMDLMLPGLSGEDLIEAIRDKKTTPIIVITAKSDMSVLVDVFARGANDYIAKPFHIQEVLARVAKQLVSQPHVSEPKLLIYQDISLDPITFEVVVSGKKMECTSKEFELLKCFVSEPQRVFTKALLYESVWKETFYGDDNTISVHISRLRAKLKELSGHEYIQTIWGIGFKLEI